MLHGQGESRPALFVSLSVPMIIGSTRYGVRGTNDQISNLVDQYSIFGSIIQASQAWMKAVVDILSVYLTTKGAKFCAKDTMM